MSPSQRRVVAAGVALVLAGTPVVASACALWCPPGMTHGPAASRQAALAGSDDAPAHDACLDHDQPPASAAGPVEGVLAPAPAPALADADCCTVDRVDPELPRVLERHDGPLDAARVVTVPRLPALRRAAARAPDIPRALPRLSRTSVLRI